MDSLSKALIDSHGKCGLTASRWFDHLVDDVFAGFGLTLQTVPDSDVTEHLFTLSGLYANEVINHVPFTDLLGPVHMELVSLYQQKAYSGSYLPNARHDASGDGPGEARWRCRPGHNCSHNNVDTLLTRLAVMIVST